MLARRLLKNHLATEQEQAPPRMLAWIGEAQRAARDGRDPPVLVSDPSRRLLASLHDPSSLGQEGEGHESELLLVLREENHSASIEALISAFRLTTREAEMLHWVCKGKTNKDIGEILGSSPRTVNKHLGHVFCRVPAERDHISDGQTYI